MADAINMTKNTQETHNPHDLTYYFAKWTLHKIDLEIFISRPTNEGVSQTTQGQHQ